MGGSGLGSEEEFAELGGLHSGWPQVTYSLWEVGGKKDWRGCKKPPLETASSGV
jgi:hypothetical protein